MHLLAHYPKYKIQNPAVIFVFCHLKFKSEEDTFVNKETGRDKFRV